MDLVQDFQEAFNTIKKNPVKDISELVVVLKKHGQDPDNSSTWRWDVMRAVVEEDMDYVHLVTATELRYCYEEQKILLVQYPEVLKVTAMLLHTQYENYGAWLDVVAIQKEVFGPELFAIVEEKTIKFLDRHIASMLIDSNTRGKDRIDYANYYYKVYEQEYQNYHYWPHIKAVMDKTLASLE